MGNVAHLRDAFKIVNIIKCLYEKAQCSINIEQVETNTVKITTEVRQCCILSPVLLGIVLDFVMRRTEETKRGIDCTDEKVLGDLDFSEDVCLVNSFVEEMQTKTKCLSSNANKVQHFH